MFKRSKPSDVLNEFCPSLAKTKTALLEDTHHLEMFEHVLRDNVKYKNDVRELSDKLDAVEATLNINNNVMNNLRDELESCQQTLKLKNKLLDESIKVSASMSFECDYLRECLEGLQGSVDAKNSTIEEIVNERDALKMKVEGLETVLRHDQIFDHDGERVIRKLANQLEAKDNDSKPVEAGVLDEKHNEEDDVYPESEDSHVLGAYIRSDVDESDNDSDSDKQEDTSVDTIYYSPEKGHVKTDIPTPPITPKPNGNKMPTKNNWRSTENIIKEESETEENGDKDKDINDNVLDELYPMRQARMKHVEYDPIVEYTVANDGYDDDEDPQHLETPTAATTSTTAAAITSTTVTPQKKENKGMQRYKINRVQEEKESALLLTHKEMYDNSEDEY